MRGVNPALMSLRRRVWAGGSAATSMCPERSSSWPVIAGPRVAEKVSQSRLACTTSSCRSTTQNGTPSGALAMGTAGWWSTAPSSLNAVKSSCGNPCR